ncbi:RNA pseudouridine synthase [Fulvitalea axinellae]|uniref:RNA pseudouridine synthase n=1 Tax=Fulvitalea axinellae TaxID=1182444 RepID=A0AAU9CUP7_9BACT|nr:RNA pseudouridine synthase [Fulvitalea axinellae]
MKRIRFEDLIIFENDNYVVVNKPPRFSTLDDRHEDTSVLSLAKAHDEELQACHRLDKDTSGALVFAKNPEAYRNLSIQFEKRQVNKVYHAVIDGLHEYHDKVCELPILPLKHGVVKIDYSKGKPAETLFNTLEGYKRHTLVEARPRTGRMHQIRIHLAAMRTPITGDTRYGGKELFLSEIKKKYNIGRYVEEQPLIGRFALHAKSIEFKDVDGKVIFVEAPYPKDFRVLIKQLDKNRR